jgi:uncharacterized protein YehS (DUF1456 family)
MNANEKYHNWLEGYLRETIDTALEKAFKDLQIDNEDTRCTLMSLIDGFIRNQADFYKKRKTDLVVMKKSRIEYFSKTFKVHKIRKQKMLEVFYELSAAIDLLDKDSYREHHDVIVEKGDQGII